MIRDSIRPLADKMQNSFQRGFTLIEALTFLFIFSMITMSFYETWTLGTKHIINAKNRLGATALANQRMEILRSLIYDDIGTIAGIPAGTIMQDQSIAVNTITYKVHTEIPFVDDPTDGLLSLGTDTAPNDYKKATIRVSWGGGSPSETVEVTSIFSLDGVESVAAGTGILSVNVLDSSGAGVSGASVHIVNSTVSPPVNTTLTTDATGNATSVGARASIQAYSITVSKSGSYSNQTYPPYPTSTFNPVNVHASVVAGSLTTTTLVLDRTSGINFQTVNPFGLDVPDIMFSLSGGLVLGTTPPSGDPVYDYSSTETTNGDGEWNISGRSAGSYSIDLDSSETGYEYVRLDPEELPFGNMSVLPNTTKTVKMIVASKSYSSAIITVNNAADTTAVSGASVRLFNTTLGYDVSVTTDTYGRAFFPNVDTPLVAGNYDIEISASGFNPKTSNISVSGSILEKKTMSLTAL